MTIIQIDDADKYLALSQLKAEEIFEGRACEKDMIFLKNNGDNATNINKMKSIEDHCSNIPNKIQILILLKIQNTLKCKDRVLSSAFLKFFSLNMTSLFASCDNI